MKTINSQELKQKLDIQNPTLKLINALEDHKFQLSHIPGSINLFTPKEIKKSLNLNDEIVVYCTDLYCNKSIILYHLLDSMGYKNVYRFAGGLIEWEANGFPIEGTMAKKVLGKA